MAGLIYHLQTRGYGGNRYARHTLASVSRAIGVREQRRIVGDHLLTEAEVLGGARFPDAVAVGTYHLDFHWPDRVKRAAVERRKVPPARIEVDGDDPAQRRVRATPARRPHPAG